MQAAKDRQFQIVMAAHDQGASYMADGYTRISGGPAVVIAINGPGATNCNKRRCNSRYLAACSYPART